MEDAVGVTVEVPTVEIGALVGAANVDPTGLCVGAYLGDRVGDSAGWEVSDRLERHLGDVGCLHWLKDAFKSQYAPGSQQSVVASHLAA